MKIRVLLADDHPAFREGLCRLLKDEEDIEIVAVASNGNEAISLAEQLRPDVAAVDVTMPGLSGIEAAKHIKKACPTTAILVISAYDYEYYVLASLRAGAVGYILKDAPVRDLVSAIRMVHAGEAVFGLKTGGNILRRLGGEGNDKEKMCAELRARELEVLKLVAQGMSNKEIASALVVSERTVQSHLINIFRKLGVRSRTGAALRAFRMGWLMPDNQG